MAISNARVVAVTSSFTGTDRFAFLPGSLNLEDGADRKEPLGMSED